MNATEKRIARRAIKYLKEHGLDFEVTWKLGGDAPPEIQSLLDGHIESCFPSDPEEVAAQVIEMIEMELKN